MQWKRLSFLSSPSTSGDGKFDRHNREVWQKDILKTKIRDHFVIVIVVSEFDFC